MERTPIVCALDQSDAARPTLERAVALASWRAVELHVVHVLPGGGATPRQTSGEAVQPDVLDPGTRSWVAELLAGAPLGPEVVRTFFYRGDPATAIATHARRHGASLVVAGSRRFRRLRRYRASVARALARAAVCPVLVVPPDAAGPGRTPAGSFSAIVCGIDFSAASAAALARALTLAQEAGGRLHVMHVLDGLPNEAMLTGGRALGFLQELRAQKAGAEARLRAAIPESAHDWCRVTTAVSAGTAHREIVKAADEAGADLIVVGGRRRSLLDAALGGTTLAAVLQQANCPVLTVPATGHVPAWPAPPDQPAGEAHASPSPDPHGTPSSWPSPRDEAPRSPPRG